jgi:hypothetical protein
MSFKHGDMVEIIPGSYFVGNVTTDKFLNTKLYVREIRKNNLCSIGSDPIKGHSVGIISMDCLRHYNEIPEGFTPYVILTETEVTTKVNPEFLADDKVTLPLARLYTVIDEKDGYGRLKDDRGWIDLTTVQKLG